MLNLPLPCYRINHFSSPIHHSLLIPTHLSGIWHFILLQNKQTLLFQSVCCSHSPWLLLLCRSSLTAPCSAQNPEPGSSKGPDSTEQDHFTSPAGPFAMAEQDICVLANHHNAQVLFIDPFLVVAFLVIAIDRCSLRAALCIHCSCHSLFPDDFICFQVQFSSPAFLFIKFADFRLFLIWQIFEEYWNGSSQDITVELRRAEHRMASCSMGWKWEKTMPL